MKLWLLLALVLALPNKFSGVTNPGGSGGGITQMVCVRAVTLTTRFFLQIEAV